MLTVGKLYGGTELEMLFTCGQYVFIVMEGWPMFEATFSMPYEAGV